MLIKQRFIVLVVSSLLSFSLFGENYSPHSLDNLPKPNNFLNGPNNYSTHLYNFHKSLNELHKDLSEYHYLLNSKDLWVVEDEGSTAGITVFHKGEIINTLVKKFYEKNNMWNTNAASEAQYVQRHLEKMSYFSSLVKLEIRSNLIPAIEDAIKHHPDNPNSPNYLNPKDQDNIQIIGATECHSIGSGSYIIGDKNTLGTKCTYYSNGRLKSETQYAHNQKHGLERWYYDTGDLSSAGDNFNGRKVGVWRMPYRPGTYQNIEAYCIEYDDNGNFIRRIPSC